MVEKMKNEIQDRKNIFWSLTVGIVLSLGLYVYFVSHTVYAVVERQKAEHSITMIENSIGDLESNYLNLKSKVTVELAVAKGFKDISSEATFIPRKPLGKSLSFESANNLKAQ